MFETLGIRSIPSITELRMDTSTLVDYVYRTEETVLVQKNGIPYAVLLTPQEFARLTQERNTEHRQGEQGG